jgi:hypothetical protein
MASIEIALYGTPENGTIDYRDRYRGTVTDLREEQRKSAPDLTTLNPESDSNEIDESDLQYEQSSEHRV